MDSTERECNLLSKAYLIAKAAHAEQVDKGGNPYIGHPLAVATMVRDSGGNKHAQSAALLHDVVEDGGVTLDELREQGIPENVVSAVDALTQRDGESRSRYMARVRANKIATMVKTADLKHNMDLSRIPKLESFDLRRAARYGLEIAELTRWALAPQ